MTSMCTGSAVASLLLGLSVMQAGVSTRSASVEDTANVTTDVSELHASFEGSDRFEAAENCISITTQDFEVALPIERLVSITQAGKSVDVLVDWRGKTSTISGIPKGEVRGKSEFGDFKLPADKIRQMIFKTPPSRRLERESDGQQTAVLIRLTNGRLIRLDGFKRHDSYYSSAGYIIGGRTRYNYYDDFRFLRGDSLSTIKFTDLRRIEFGPEGAVTVVTRKNTTTPGKLSNEDDAGVDGWTGRPEVGYAFLDPKAIRAIDFASLAAK